MFARSLLREGNSPLAHSTLLARLLGLGALMLPLIAAGCTNGVGSNCEIRQDCAAGLTCCTASCASPARGTCQASCDGIVCVDASSTELDAFVPGGEADASSPPDASGTADASSPPDASGTADAADVDGGT